MIYGAENGYNWKKGDIVSAMFIYVPVSEALAAAKTSAIKLVAMGTGCILFSLLLIAVYLGIKIVTPIEMLSKRTEEISLGKNLDTPITVKPNREIGELGRSIDRLRLSIARLIKKRS
jgi:methyl-accepting chemotaxis protein